MPKSRVELADELDTALKQARSIAAIVHETIDKDCPEEGALWTIMDLLDKAQRAADGIDAMRQRGKD